MGLFGNDQEKSARLESLEIHIRELTETVIQSGLDIAALRLAQINLQNQIDGKVSSDAVDPAIRALNEQLGVAREELAKATAAAEDSWATLSAGATEALGTLRKRLEKASADIERNLKD